MGNDLVIGSLGALAKQANLSIAEAFMRAKLVILIDTSGSMGAHDSRGGKSRYDVACEELVQLQAAHPGQIAVVAFSGDARLCPSGIPFFYGGGTNLANGLRFIKAVDIVKGMRFIVISDGEPDDEAEALCEARAFQNRIDVIYIGPEDRPGGRAFLERLARATGGKQVSADRAMLLAEAATRLLQRGG